MKVFKHGLYLCDFISEFYLGWPLSELLLLLLWPPAADGVGNCLPGFLLESLQCDLGHEEDGFRVPPVKLSVQKWTRLRGQKSQAEDTCSNKIHYSCNYISSVN